LANTSQIKDTLTIVAQLIAIVSAISAAVMSINFDDYTNSADSLRGAPKIDNGISGCIDNGLRFLSDQQNSLGYWTYDGERGSNNGIPNVGITSLATLAFINSNDNKYNEICKNGLDWIRSQSNEDGSISSNLYQGWKVYDTSLAILALIASNNIEYNDEIKKGTDFLIKAQNDEGEGYNISDTCYGGWGYSLGSPTKWSDLSNTQFALMAIHAARLAGVGTAIPLVGEASPIWNKAELFLKRCQASDGGFIYRPENLNVSQGTMTSAGISYGSMTAAGAWCLLLCGENYSETSLSNSLNWLDSAHYYIDRNYPYSTSWLYYYLMTLNKAYIMAEELGWKSKHPYYYNDISNFLIKNQEMDGHWKNIEGEESSDILSTIEAITALQSKRGEIKPQYKRLSWLAFNLHSNADLHVYDPLGRHVGIDYIYGNVATEIPGAKYEVNNSGQFIEIQNLESGEYTYKLIGTSDGEYSLDISSGIANKVNKEKTISKKIANGEYYEGSVSILGTPNLPMHTEIQSAIKKQNVMWDVIWLIRLNPIFLLLALILLSIMILKMVVYFKENTSILIKDETNRNIGYKYLAIDLTYLFVTLYSMGIAAYRSTNSIQSDILLLAAILGSTIYLIKDNCKKTSIILWIALLIIGLSLVYNYITNYY
jgi:prenyltransferase beta subunit